jgi:hypothetical protein
MFEQIASFIARNVRNDSMFADEEQFDLACRMYDCAIGAGYTELDARQIWGIYDRMVADTIGTAGDRI